MVGRGYGENFIASDIPAFLEHTRQMVVVDDGCVVELRAESIEIRDLEGRDVEQEHRQIDWDFDAAEKGGFPTFMLKEIHEQPPPSPTHLSGGWPRMVAYYSVNWTCHRRC